MKLMLLYRPDEADEGTQSTNATPLPGAVGRARVHSNRRGATGVNGKWARHYRSLLALRERLLRERRDLVKTACEPLERFSMDMADAAADQFEHDMVLSRLSAKQDALYEVDSAIERILEGTYGVCDETGEPIPQARLRAVPWTRFAREAEENLEKCGIVGGPHLGRVGSVRGEVSDGNLQEIESGEDGAEGNVANDESLEQVFVPSVKPTLRHKTKASARVAEEEVT